MGLIRQLFKTTFDLATMPIDMVKDLTTMGGILTDQDQPYTIRKIQTLDKDIQKIGNEIEKDL